MVAAAHKMQKFVVFKLLVLSLLPILCKGNLLKYTTGVTILSHNVYPLKIAVLGQNKCANGQTTTAAADSYITQINEYRSTTAAGNQLNGKPDAKLPKAKSMNSVAWSCDLEKKLIDGKLAANCPDAAPTNPDAATTTLLFST
ncbi:hypothetical protein OESDEN_18164 [Oesophagostomum dentatum]|uniref:SCP domain-containing protein n=1 Tax=Oesophagostomum dentatum TaxID=61180 RepID=A0A0B1SB84_OESDE|nr:hypothetical protein OESDEN_18164 [Oesophagostomum dentatum]